MVNRTIQAKYLKNKSKKQFESIETQARVYFGFLHEKNLKKGRKIIYFQKPLLILMQKLIHQQ